MCKVPFSNVSFPTVSAGSLSQNLPTKMSSADCGGWEESTRAAACKEEGGGGGGGRVGGDGRRCLDSRQTPQQSLDGWLTPQPRPAGARLGPNLNPVSLSDYSNFPSFPTLPPLPLIHAATSKSMLMVDTAAGWNEQIVFWRGCAVSAMLPSSQPAQGCTVF